MSYKRTGYWTANLWKNKKGAWKEALPGVHRRILANSQSASMLQFRFDPGSVVKKHGHPHAQYGVCLEGGGDFVVGSKVWKVKEGDSWYIPPGMKHEYRNNPNTASVIIECFTPQREEYEPDFTVE